MEFGIRHLLNAPAGQLVFNNYAAPNYLRLTSIEGADAPPLRTSIEDLSQRDGAIVRDALGGALIATFEGDIVVADAYQRRWYSDVLEGLLWSMRDADGEWLWYPTGSNLVHEGDFEVDVGSWYGYNGGGGATPSLSVTTFAGYVASGAKALQVVATNGEGVERMKNVIGGTSYEPVAEGDRLLVTAVLGGDASVSEPLALGLLSSGSAVGYSPATFPTLFTTLPGLATQKTTAGDGVSVGFVFTVPAGVTGLVPYLAQVLPAGASRTWGADAVRIGHYRDDLFLGFLNDAPRRRLVRLYAEPKIIGGYAKRFQFALAAGDPLAYSKFERTMPQAIGTGQTAALVNRGHVPTWPRIRILGQTSPTATLTLNGVTVFRLAALVAAGQTIEIDTREETIVDVATGALRMDLLDPTVSPGFFSIPPGTHTLGLTGGGGIATTYLRDAWLG